MDEGAEKDAAEFQEGGQIEILFRLPVNQLAIVRTYSKSWFNLINEPFFIDRYHPKLTAFFYQVKTDDDKPDDPQFLLVQPGSVKIPDPDLNFLRHKNVSSSIQVIDSCNGILLCSGSSVRKDSLLKTWFVCNPTTMDHITLPYPNARSWKAIYALNAGLSNNGISEFKVLCIFKSEYDSKLSIFSSNTGVWEDFETPLPPVCENPFLGSKAFCKNRLLWDRFEGKILISYLDSNHQNYPFELIDLPEVPMGRFLWSFEDKIRCYCYGFVGKYPAWSIRLDEHKSTRKWVLENCEEFKNLSENVCRWLTLKVDTPFRFRILTYRPETSKFFLFIAGSIYSYDLKYRNLEGIWAHPYHQSKFQSSTRIIPYIISLAQIQKWNYDANVVQEDCNVDNLESAKTFMESVANIVKPHKSRRKTIKTPSIT